MGQYYKPVILTANKKQPLGFVDSHDFASGLKLMEHSWIGNNFVGFVEGLLFRNPTPLVWAGDYADNEDPTNISKETLKALINYNDNDPECAIRFAEDGATLYQIARALGVKIGHNFDFKNFEERYNHDFGKVPSSFKYLVNHDKKEFVDKTKTPKCTAGWMEGAGWQIHPLPLLTCEGNGRGGGDYHEDSEANKGDKGLIGYWSRDVISVESRKSDIPKNFKEITFDLTEG